MCFCCQVVDAESSVNEDFIKTFQEPFVDHTYR